MPSAGLRTDPQRAIRTGRPRSALLAISRLAGAGPGRAEPASITVITRSASSARASARRTPSASMLSEVSRRPAVSTSVTGTPPSTTRVSSASRVVPGICGDDRHVAFRQRVDQRGFADVRRAGDGEEQALAQLLAAAGIVEMGARSPAGHARSVASSWSSTSGGRSSSGKSISASWYARMPRSRSAQSWYSAPSAPSSCRSACRRCASVSAAIRSWTASASTRSMRPFRKARRVNSPGSAGRKPGFGQRVRHAVDHRPAAVQMQFGTVLAGIGARAGKPQHQRMVQHAARPDRAGGRSEAWRGGGRQPAAQRCHSRSRTAGPLRRMTAMAARAEPEARAKIVSDIMAC